MPILAPCWSASSTLSRLKLPGFWRGGNALKVARNCPTVRNGDCAVMNAARPAVQLCWP